LWLVDGELSSFAGTVGYEIAEFNSVDGAQNFLLKGISKYDTNPEIWGKIRAVKILSKKF